MNRWYGSNTIQQSVWLARLNSKILLKTTFRPSTVSNFSPLKINWLEELLATLKLWVNNLSLTCLLWSNDCSILSSKSSTCLGCQNHYLLLICSLLMSQFLLRPKKSMFLSKLYKLKSIHYKLKGKLCNPKSKNCRLINKHCRPKTKNYMPRDKPYNLKKKLKKFKHKSFLR